ncbi:CFEM domain-containing protein [Fusarium mexicanum]|uniref:CFEM domain-containing protein n=1 Tax=Fusarium mexicanum TaxID=751941 RepID=A0A8H5I6L9_9HYPO|nr:CFEM domain-containing protein [Fusarium mexicanum]
MTECGAPVRDKTLDLAILAITVTAIAGLCVIARIAYKLYILVDYGLDDWMSLATMISAVVNCVVLVCGSIPNGLGKDAWAVEQQTITTFLRYTYMTSWLYYLQTALMKLIFICFYMRIFGLKTGVRYLLWGTLILTSAWGLAFVVVSLFQCHPIHRFWTAWAEVPKSGCANSNTISWVNAITSIVLDLWILGIPLWQLRSLHLHWTKKVGAAFMFCIGTCVVVVSIIRLHSLTLFASTSNATWDLFEVTKWSVIEINIGLACTCLPTLRSALAKWFPDIIGASQNTDRSQFLRYGDDKSSFSAIPLKNTSTVSASTVRGTPQPSTGILVQNSFTLRPADDEPRFV